ncbi:MAG TPA: sulfotransferase, partial [Rudaea sp.]
ARRPWDARAHSGEVDRILHAFAIPATVGNAARGDGTVFIVSLPRAGSTLAEQILAAHPVVAAGDERLDALDVLGAESQRRGKPLAEWAPHASETDWARLGDEYLARTAPVRGDARVFTDKLPSNWIVVGALFAMLPGARVVECRRDRVEVAWSCFTQLFANGTQDFSHDFASIAAFTADYDRAMRHWHQRFPLRIHTQTFEALLDDPATQIRALLEFCGLAFEPACLRFHEHRRSVRTLSASQVREPLRRDTARAHKYGALLDPLRDALGLARFKKPDDAI